MSAFGESRYTSAFAGAISDAGERLTDRQTAAIDKLVRDLWKWNKGIKLETMFRFFYPFVGGTALSHSFNLANPAVGKITWLGSVTHSANGVTGSTAAGSRGNTGMKLNGAAKTDAYVGIGVYCRTATAQDRCEMGNAKTGTFNAIAIYCCLGNGHFQYYNCGITPVCDVVVGTSQGCQTAIRDSAGLYCYNGSDTPFVAAVGDSGTPVTPLSSQGEFAILDTGVNAGTNAAASNRNLALAWLSNRIEGGTAGMDVIYEQAAFYTLIEAYQDLLNRGVF